MYLTIALLGLGIGSFLNVVIYRIPEQLKQESADPNWDFRSFNLAFPGSHCPSCKKSIPIWRNIPLLTYLIQGGRCHACHVRIPVHYFFVELVSIVLALFCLAKFGLSWHGAFAFAFSVILLALIVIDLQHFLLPDDLTLSLLWLALLYSLTGEGISSQQAIVGAALAYVFLWVVGTGFAYWKGYEGMGYGDYKLAAAIGASLGWEIFPLFILLAALLSLFVGGAYLLLRGGAWKTRLPFGPFLAASGFLLYFWGSEMRSYWLGVVL